MCVIITVFIVIANIFNINVAQQFKRVFGMLKRTLLLLVPNVLFLKKSHRKKSQSESEAVRKYDV